MAKRIWKALSCVALSAFVLVTSNGATRASNVPADAPAQDGCSDWEDWDNLRFWGVVDRQVSHFLITGFQSARRKQVVEPRPHTLGGWRKARLRGAEIHLESPRS